MRAPLAALLLLILASAEAMSQDGKKKDDAPRTERKAIKTDFTRLEYLGLKARSFVVQITDQPTPAGDSRLQGRIIYELEFEKDVVNYDLDALQKIMAPQSKRLRHLFFDEGNVAINSYFQEKYSYGIMGEVSGVKGEAFRVIVEFNSHPPEIINAIRQHGVKLVVRPGN
jgi:hypothetical protein